MIATCMHIYIMLLLLQCLSWYHQPFILMLCALVSCSFIVKYQPPTALRSTFVFKPQNLIFMCYVQIRCPLLCYTCTIVKKCTYVMCIINIYEHHYRGFLVPCMHFFMMRIRCLAQEETALLVYH